MEKENQRVRLTKRLIKDSFLELLNTHSFEEITVSKICDKAEINRTTFYKYFDNQYQLLDVLEKELIEELESYGKESKYFSQDEDAAQSVYKAQLDFFRCIENKLPIYRTLVSRIHPNIFEKTQVLRNEANIKAFVMPLGNCRASYASEFIIAGGQKIVETWIMKDKNRETPEEMTDIILDIVYGTLEKLRKGFQD
jgi:AcrR family transcriptional regulator